MNIIFKDDLASLMAGKFSVLIREYDLKVVRIDESEALLVGVDYALQFSADQDSLDVMYLEKDRRGLLSIYTLRSLVMQRFTQEDRAYYGNPVTIKEKLIASLNVYASGLANRCSDVLRGDKSWLKRDSWNAGEPDALVKQTY